MRTPRSLLAMLGVAAALSGAPAGAQSPSAAPLPSAGPSASPALTVPLCEDVPRTAIPAERFADTPVYVANEQPARKLRRWARQQPGYQDMWIDRDHLGWVVLAFSEDADARQADLEREFPGVGAVAVEVPWTNQQLERIQQRSIGMRDLVVGSYIDIRKGVVGLMIGPLEPERIETVARRFAGDPVCVEGIDPATVPAPGPQPQAGDGWTLLGEGKVGEPYRTGIAADQASFEALWKETRLPGPAPTVDFEQQVAIWFGAVYGGSCPAIRLDDVVVDPADALVHALIVQTEAVMVCTADANGHAYVVALDRDRLPAPPFRIQLQAGNPPPGATEETTLVEADLRPAGSVPGPGQVHPISPPQEQRYLRSGAFIETGYPAAFLADARCGLEWLGRLNGVWWRTDVPAGDAAFVPDAWQSAVDTDGMVPVTVLLRSAGDPAVTDGQPRVEVTANDETVVYHASAEPAPACP